ncbi:hypothetical protein PsAD2_00865 [Pseudovibrio axinellae]|uniref:Uncharacterized protein n=1 Tax=Pseudovibrio axinellae TaxID=989403 RepID=A0A166AUG9_9HYPH|nr:hypothetical protein PsAD2_00865 [Pseudovibrio axinellae]SER09811.1 hypothetical protein SAMN05421798_106136 [Pseudovibrio axinellae]
MALRLMVVLSYPSQFKSIFKSRVEYINKGLGLITRCEGAVRSAYLNGYGENLKCNFLGLLIGKNDK